MTTELRIPNWIAGTPAAPAADRWLDKIDPHSGAVISQLADSDADDARRAVDAAAAAFDAWSATTPVKRGQILADLVAAMKTHAAALADCIAVETGKPRRTPAGEVGGAT